MRPTPPVRGRCPEGAQGVGITGPYVRERNGYGMTGGHMGPPLRNGKKPYRRADEDIRPYGRKENGSGPTKNRE